MQGVLGCGKLLFEVVNGVDGQFHNCAEQFLPFYFKSLWSEKYQDTVFDIVEHVVANVADRIHQTKNKLFWDILIKNLVTLQDNHNARVFEYILKLVGQMVEYKNGKLLPDPTVLVQQLVKLLSLTDLDESEMKIAIQVSISVLLSKCIRLPQEQASQLIRKILSTTEKKLLLYFVENTGSSSLFETLILPTFLSKCGYYGFDEDCIYTLTKLVVSKRPLCVSGVSLGTWSKYSLDFKQLRSEIFEKLFSFLNIADSHMAENYFCALICLPHLELKSDQKTVLMEKLHANFFLLLSNADRQAEPSKIRTLLFWLNILLEAIVHLGGTTSIQEKFEEIVQVLLKYASEVKYLSALKSLDLLLEAFKDSDSLINWNMLETINAVCEGNFNSPYHEVSFYS